MSLFTHSNTKRRELVVYGLVGKGGLFLPLDFSNQPEIDQEQQPLLNNRRRLSIHHEIVNEERQFLTDLNIEAPADDDGVELVFLALSSRILENTTLTIELRALFKALIPLVTTFVLQNSLSTVSVFTVGHLGAAELAAVLMGAMTANITGYATIQGIATSLDTVCPQAFGAGNYKLVGTYMQRCMAIIMVVMAPILVMWAGFGDQLLLLVVPDPATARLAGMYLRYVTPGIPAYVLFECGKRYLQAQGVFHVLTLCLMVAAPLNLIMNITLVKYWGYIGAPIAVAINYWVMALLLVYLTVFKVLAGQTPLGLNPRECWPGFSVKNAFSGWGTLISLAIPGLIMLEAEFLAFEILTLLASRLGTINLAAQLIGATLASLTYQVPFAIGIAALTRIANFLGAGLSRNAYRATLVALLFGLGSALFNFIMVSTFRVPIAKLFTEDPLVIEALNNVIWYIAVMQVVDSMNAVLAGCLRGQGQTKIGGIVNLVAYYVVGLPLSIYWSFYSPWRGDIKGLWIGCIVSLVIIAGVQSWCALKANFTDLVIAARKRGGALPAH